jgi:hypothetical protein
VLAEGNNGRAADVSRATGPVNPALTLRRA